jgi:hypothetical protein
VGGELTMRPEVIDVFCQELPGRVSVVTNGTYPLNRFDDLYFYWISLDGTEKVHDSIRGKVPKPRRAIPFWSTYLDRQEKANRLGKTYGYR